MSTAHSKTLEKQDNRPEAAVTLHIISVRLNLVDLK